MLTVESLASELGLKVLAGGDGAAEREIRWVHISELLDPDALALGRRAPAHHRHPAGERREAAGVRPPACRRGRRRPRIRHRLRSREGPEGGPHRGRGRPRSLSSRSRTRRPSSRSPRRPSAGWSTSSTTCSPAASRSTSASSGSSCRAAAWKRSRARSPPRSGAALSCWTPAERCSPTGAAASPEYLLDAVRTEVQPRGTAAAPFVPSQPDLRGRALAHPVSPRPRVARRPGWSWCGARESSGTSSASACSRRRSSWRWS